ncbi:hypothetical protein BKI52_38270 [marine bacterium AO1-C]|nr:hypothetical protein BKI52_38270 [marine bacterium AO1-C]
MWQQYLQRIGCSDLPINIDQDTLIALHQQHVLTVPFEVLDIHCNVPFALNFEATYDKVVNRNRGGFCYELNYLFYRLLTHLGFKAHMVSSRIYDREGVLGPEYDHMSMLVVLNNDWWLLDVGYGDLFISPIQITDRQVFQDWFKYFKIEQIEGANYLLSESTNGSKFIKRYQFSTTPRALADFEAQFEFKQHSPNSHFVQNLICTLPHKTGRHSIVNNQHIATTNGIKTITKITNEAAFRTLLKDKFNLHIEGIPPMLF